MCQGCFAEYGSPTQLPDDGATLVDLIRRLYAQPDGGSGGPLHVVLDDWNLEDVHLKPYGESADWEPETWRLAQQISERLLPLTLEQRAAVMAEEDGMLVDQ